MQIFSTYNLLHSNLILRRKVDLVETRFPATESPRMHLEWSNGRHVQPLLLTSIEEMLVKVKECVRVGFYKYLQFSLTDKLKKLQNPSQVPIILILRENRNDKYIPEFSNHVFLKCIS